MGNGSRKSRHPMPCARRFIRASWISRPLPPATGRSWRAQPARWYFILDLAAKGPVTLLYASRDRQHNNALVLADFLEDEIERRGPGSSPVCYADRLA